MLSALTTVQVNDGSIFQFLKFSIALFFLFFFCMFELDLDPNKGLRHTIEICIIEVEIKY